jgi:hypothetical protein
MSIFWTEVAENVYRLLEEYISNDFVENDLTRDIFLLFSELRQNLVDTSG